MQVVSEMPLCQTTVSSSLQMIIPFCLALCPSVAGYCLFPIHLPLGQDAPTWLVSVRNKGLLTIRIGKHRGLNQASQSLVKAASQVIRAK
ncbi:unnamed protein product [Lota lota]